MAPTKTAMLCVGGRVGRYFDKRWVGQSPERAGPHNKGLVGGKKEKGAKHTYFDCVRRKVVYNWVLRLQIKTCQRERGKEVQKKLTLITFSNFSGPLTPLIESL